MMELKTYRFLDDEIWYIVSTWFKEVKRLSAFLFNHLLRNGGNKAYHAGYVGGIEQILVLHKRKKTTQKRDGALVF